VSLIDLHPGNMLIHTKINSKLNSGGATRSPPLKNSVLPIEIWDIGNIKNGSFNIKNGPPLSISRNDDITACLVDAGMVAQLTAEEASIYIGLLASIGAGDGQQAAQFALQFSIDQQLDDLEQQAFIQDMILLFDERCHGYGTNVDIGNVLRGVLG
jgi:predicted unusual protein kinase regulating ubiquinone biosynthesis (AarF/ABC1/UbiB family)